MECDDNDRRNGHIAEGLKQREHKLQTYTRDNVNQEMCQLRKNGDNPITKTSIEPSIMRTSDC